MGLKHKSKFTVCVILFLLVWGYLSGYAYRQQEIVLISDEEGFMNYGALFFKHFFILRDFFGDIWQQPFGAYGIHNPKGAMFFLGFMQLIAQKLKYFVYMPVIDIVVVLRIIVSSFSAAGVVFMYLFLGNISKGSAKFLAVALMICSPVFMSVSIALLPEVLLFFSACVSLYLLSILDKESFAVGVKLSVLLGFCLGFCFSSRIYGFCLYMVFVCLCLIRYKKISPKLILRQLILVSVVFGFTFFITNPSLYLNPIQGILMMGPGHVEYLTKGLFGKDIEAVGYLLKYPFLLFNDNELDILQIMFQQPLGVLSRYAILTGYILSCAGLWFCCKTKQYIPLLLLICSVIWVANPLYVLGVSIMAPKSMLIPNMAVICLVSLAFGKSRV
nr:hypothetical protein 4 [bacterium]